MTQMRQQLAAWYGTFTTFDFCSILTLVMLAQVGPSQSVLRSVIATIAVVGIVVRPLQRSVGLWFTICVFYTAGIILNWWWLDNHVWLIGYLCLALLFAAATPEHQDLIVILNARWLIFLCMAFAVLWKLASPDYLTGSFFTETLLTDSRFFGFASLTTGIPIADLYANHTLIHGYVPGGIAQPPVLTTTGAVETVAAFMTWWTIGIESLLAVLFLLPSNRWVVACRSCVLLLFIGTTYWFAPVLGFGWALAICGLASVRQHGFRVAFLLAFFFVQLFQAPYESVFRALGFLN